MDIIKEFGLPIAAVIGLIWAIKFVWNYFSTKQDELVKKLEEKDEIIVELRQENVKLYERLIEDGKKSKELMTKVLPYLKDKE